MPVPWHSPEELLAQLAVARHERRLALDQRELLALDNLALARRVSEAERLLSEHRSSYGLGKLFGWSTAEPGEAEGAAQMELHARADENLQLQHALFDQAHDHRSERHRLDATRAERVAAATSASIGRACLCGVRLLAALGSCILLGVLLGAVGTRGCCRRVRRLEQGVQRARLGRTLELSIGTVTTSPPKDGSN